MPVSDCVFCGIAAGQSPKALVYEDDHHLAFLDIFPAAEAATVVIPKTHQPSDFSLADPQAIGHLVRAAQIAVRRLKAADSRIERCVLNFEGRQVAHLHANLLPLRSTDSTPWQTWIPPSSPLSLAELEKTAGKIRQANA